MPLPLIVIAAAIFLLASGDADRSKPEPRAAAQSETGPVSVRACDLLSRRQAQAALERVRPEPVVRGVPPVSDTCTYYRPGNRVTATVGLYRAERYEPTVRVLPHIKRDTVAGRRAIYDPRLGYLIQLPGRPYYMQVTFFHVVHTHADRPASKSLAKQVLTGQTQPAAQYICSLTGEPS